MNVKINSHDIILRITGAADKKGGNDYPYESSLCESDWELFCEHNQYANTFWINFMGANQQR